MGVDPSLTNTAVVVLSVNKEGEGSVLTHYNFKNEISNSKFSNDIERLILIRKHMQNILHTYTPIVCCYENYSYKSINRAFSLGELGGVLKTTLYEKGVKLVLVEPTVLKKFATDNGLANKERMQEKAMEESTYFSNLPKKEFTNDIADAFFLSKMAMYYYNITNNLNGALDVNKRQRIELIRRNYANN